MNKCLIKLFLFLVVLIGAAPSRGEGLFTVGALGDLWTSNYASPYNGEELFFPVALKYQMEPGKEFYAQSEFGTGSYTDSVNGTETLNLTNFSDTLAGFKWKFKDLGPTSQLNVAFNIPTGDTTWEAKEQASNIPEEFVNTRYQGRGFGVDAIYALSFPEGQNNSYGVGMGYLYAGAFNPSYGLNYTASNSLKLGDSLVLALNHIQKDDFFLSEIIKVTGYYSFATSSNGQNNFELGPNVTASYAWVNRRDFSLEVGGQVFLPSSRLNAQGQFGTEPYNSYAPRFFVTPSYITGPWTFTAQFKFIFQNDVPVSDPFYGQYYDGGGFLASIGPTYEWKLDKSSSLLFSGSFAEVDAFNLGTDSFGNRTNVNFNLWTLQTTYAVKF